MWGSDHRSPAPSEFDLLLVIASYEGSGLGDGEAFLILHNLELKRRDHVFRLSRELRASSQFWGTGGKGM